MDVAGSAMLHFTTRVDYAAVSPIEFAELEGVDDWRFVLGKIVACYDTRSYIDGATLVQAIATAAAAADHHPDVRLAYPGTVRVQVATHAVGRLTHHDVDLARTISGLAADAGASACPSEAWELEMALDTMDADRIRPFWEAVLGYEDASGVLVDPQRRGPALWFQQMDQPRTQRNRFHLDISVPHDVAETRVAKAIEAGGVLVSDARAKAFWVLADADGNEICICTWQDR